MTAIPTPLIKHPPIVLLVALRDDTARICSAAIAPLPTMRAATADTAVERLPIVRPLVVVIADDLPQPDFVLVTERAADVTAVIVQVSQNDDAEKLGSSLKQAASEAEARRG
ncbi:MAG: hypothetical protein ACRELY_12725 [Polyangiaceae bacterium]